MATEYGGGGEGLPINHQWDGDHKNVKEPYGESGKFRLTQYILNPLTLTKSPPPHPSQTINDHRFLIDKLFFACCTKFPRNCFVLYNLSENWLFNMTELYKSTKEYFSRSAMLPQNVFWSLLFSFLLFFLRFVYFFTSSDVFHPNCDIKQVLDIYKNSPFYLN